MAKPTLECDPHDQLLNAVEKDDLESFKRVLDEGLGNKSIDLNHIFFEPYLGTILDICCSEPGKSEFVKKLLSAGVDVNLPNKLQKKNPIHMAAKKGHVDVLRALIEHPSTDVSAQDGDKNSALYHALQSGHVECSKLLLECKDINPNRLNRRGTNAVYAAATSRIKNDELMLAVIRCPRVHIDKIVWEKPLRETITKYYPHLKNEMPAEGTRDVIDEDDRDPFLLYLNKEDIEGFISHIKSNTDQLECDNGKFTILQYACHYGYPEVVKVLLDLGADPNKTTLHYDQHAIFIASYRGFSDIIQLFLDTGKDICFQTNETNVLLEVAKGSMESHRILGVNTELCDHGRSIKLLLTVDSQYDINLGDFQGNTSLHHVALSDNCDYVFPLLDHGAYLGRKNSHGNPPLKELSRETLELYLNKCVSSNELSPNDDNYEIICSYKFLCPPKVYTPNDDNDSQIQIETQDIIIENIPETDPLLYISKVTELKPLLLHPVLTNFLYLKWQNIKIYFMLNLAFVSVFLVVLTAYILCTTDDDTSKIHHEIANSLWFVTLGFVVVLCFRELFQIISFPITYVTSTENWLEICIITLISVLLCEKWSHEYRVSVSAIVILMSWSELILLLGRYPTFAVRLEMFKSVTKNFVFFLQWYACIFLAFILSFYVMFHDANDNSGNFMNITTTTFKTIIMISGEYDSTDLPFTRNPIIGHLLFLLFVFFITFVLMNLLSGLAVSDTQEIRNSAEIVACVSRVNYIHSAETMAINTGPNSRKQKNLFSYNILSSWTKPLQGLKLFPKALKNPYIKIFPNRGNAVDLGRSVKKSKIRYIANFQIDYLDSETVNKTKEIIRMNSEKPEKSVGEILNEFVEKINRIEKEVERIKSMIIAKT